MSTSRSNDLSRTWQQTTFTETNNDNDINLSRKLLEDINSWKNTDAYYELKNDISYLTKEQMVNLLNQDLNLDKENKIFKIIPGRKLAKYLLGADILQFGGKKMRKTRKMRKPRKMRKTRKMKKVNNNL